MKKIIALFMTMIIVLLACACAAGESGIKEPETIEPVLPTVTEKEPEPSGQQDVQDYQPVKEKTVVRILDYNIYADCPEGKYVYDEAGIYALRDASKYDFVSLVYEMTGEFEGGLDDVADHLMPWYEGSATKFTYGIMRHCPYEISSREAVQVNGFDSVKFSGTVNRDDGKQYYFYGYSFIIDDLPCAVIGIVSDPESGEAEIKAIEEETDWVASTIRTEK